MNSADEVTTAGPPRTPPPADTAECAVVPIPPPSPPADPPTPADVLGWVAAAGGVWFPSAHAARTGTRRDDLDAPLNDLRAAGLVAVVDWVRGVGQGYALTPDGRREAWAATADPDEPAGAAAGAGRRPPVVTPVLVAANVLWFFVGLVVAVRGGEGGRAYLGGGAPAALARVGAAGGPELLAGEWWRLGACGFVHVGLAHLALNMVALVLLGPWAELLWGRWRVAVIYAASGLAGSGLAMAVHPVGVAGASGAILGVLGALAAWLLVFRAHLPPALLADRAGRLGTLLVLAVGSSLIDGVSWQAHLGGGVAGFAVAVLLNAARSGRRWRRAAAVALLVALPAAAAAGLRWQMREGAAWAPVRQRAAAELALRGAAAEHARQAAERDRLRASAEGFAREVLPRLVPIQPSATKPVEDRAGQLLAIGRTGGRAGAEVRAAVDKLHAAAADAAAKLADPPPADGAFDRARERARAYAAARAAALARLAALLDPAAAPDLAARKDWLDARREADRLWGEVGRP